MRFINFGTLNFVELLSIKRERNLDPDILKAWIGSFKTKKKTKNKKRFGGFSLYVKGLITG